MRPATILLLLLPLTLAQRIPLPSSAARADCADNQQLCDGACIEEFQTCCEGTGSFCALEGNYCSEEGWECCPDGVDEETCLADLSYDDATGYGDDVEHPPGYDVPKAPAYSPPEKTPGYDIPKSPSYDAEAPKAPAYTPPPPPKQESSCPPGVSVSTVSTERITTRLITSISVSHNTARSEIPTTLTVTIPLPFTSTVQERVSFTTAGFVASVSAAAVSSVSAAILRSPGVDVVAAETRVAAAKETVHISFAEGRYGVGGRNASVPWVRAGNRTVEGVAGGRNMSMGNRTVAEVYVGGAAGVGPAVGAVVVAGCVWVALMGGL